MSFTQQTNQGVVFHTADAFSAAGGIAHGFATRIGGVSKPPFDQLNLGMCLTIYYADCIPVLLYDPVKKAIAAVHSGWRGTSLGIAPQAVQKLAARYGSDPHDILVAIGPGIGPCCFETHDDVPTAMAERLGEGVQPFYQPLPNGKFSVDLKGILRWELTQAGVPDENIDTLPLCTACYPELYWSHRKMGDRRGNHAAMIQLL